MLRFELVQFDSYGAKSSCVKVVTKDINILIDPGVAIMHPSFPAGLDDKLRWVEDGWRRIYKALEDIDIIIITHYHYDHHIPNDPSAYEGRIAVFLKNPNIYINNSQRERAEHLLKNLSTYFQFSLSYIDRIDINRVLRLALKLNSLELDFGDYNDRRKELLNKGRRWFEKRLDKWGSWGYINEIIRDEICILFPEASTYVFGNTVLHFTPPLFHGIEYSRVGWVYSVLVDDGNTRLYYSSDLNGPIIEDYSDMIIRYFPNIIILDGPMTYMFGYTLNRINLNRCIENVKRIIDNVEYDVFIWDHHLPREKRFRERTLDVWNHASKRGREILTAREYMFGRPPIVEEL